MKPLDEFTIGTATAKQNPLTRDWLIEGQKGGGAYWTTTKAGAKAMAKTVDHYNKTGEIKRF